MSITSKQLENLIQESDNLSNISDMTDNEISLDSFTESFYLEPGYTEYIENNELI